MPPRLDFELLWLRAAPLLLNGPISVKELADRLSVSQPTLSRLLAQHRPQVLSLGKARASRYVHRRSIADVGTTVPVFEIDEEGQSRTIAVLHAVGTSGVFVEPKCADVDEGLHPGVPYFLDGMRPAGFLGRLVPRQHPELRLPDEVRLWSPDHTLRYLARAGWNAVGNIIVGEGAFERYLEHAGHPAAVIDAECEQRYERLAVDVLSGAPPGSSAAGEQPKFLATRSPHRAVLVKFSPPRTDFVGRRLADLLVCEHLAHRVLTEHGQDGATSALIEGEDRLFLEVDRFDRTAKGRRGVIALEALDAEFSGLYERGGWGPMVDALVQAGQLHAPLLERARWLSTFGSLIGNNDMHPGNLSFITRGARVLGLAPVYDMLPMQYAPHQGHIIDRALDLPVPKPSDVGRWEDVCAAATDFWARVSRHPQVSEPFRELAQTNEQAVERARRLGGLLPT